MRIVMTGATSGIGLEAARVLIALGAELTVGARRPEGAPDALRGAKLIPLDLADLRSAARFAEAVGTAAPDALILNAGGQFTRRTLSAQGYEMTFAANHLAHHLIARTAAPAIATGGRVILTASGTHDPAQETGMPPPLHADARRLAYPGEDPQLDADPGKAGRRAYSTSKLANIMTARELARRIAEARPDLMVAAFDPGFTPGTGLARAYPAPVSFLFRHLLRFAIRGAHVSTPAISGRFLAELATAPQHAAARGDYFSVRSAAMARTEPSILARDAAAAAKLWDDSVAMETAA